MRTSPLVAALAAGLLTALVACTGDKSAPAGDLPPGDVLLREAAAEMRTVRTAHFTIETEGTVAGLPLSRADGVITREGNAQGTAALSQSGAVVEMSFVVVGQSLYLKGGTGGWQKLPLALAGSVYDPSAILDPDRGVAQVIATASSPKTEARESAGGADAYRIAATIDTKAVGAMVPGLGEGVTGKLWVGSGRRLLHKASFTLAGQGGTVHVTFTDFDKPVDIRAP